MHRFSRRIEQGFAVEIWGRKVGVTVTRTLYNVALFSAEGERVAYFTDLASLKQANKTATRWIDSQKTEVPTPGRASWADERKPWPRGRFVRESSKTRRVDYRHKG